MNALCRWLHEQGEAPTLVKLRPQRLEKRIIRTHDEAALRIVLGYRPKMFEHSRVHALILTILDTGCRITELPDGDGHGLRLRQPTADGLRQGAQGTPRAHVD